MATNLRALAASLKEVQLADVKMEMDLVTEQAAELREKREAINKRIIKMQDEARELSAQIRVIEQPLVDYGKLITLGVATGQMSGQSVPVSTRRGTRAPQ